MADRTSAEVFGELFATLAKAPKEHESYAKTVAKTTAKLSRNYDFSPDQMGCDKALVKLGLAKMGVDPDYPDDGKVVIYGKEIG